jgi:hypothetical protein
VRRGLPEVGDAGEAATSRREVPAAEEIRMSLDVLIEQILDRVEERLRRVLREERGATGDLLTYAEAGELVRRAPRTVARWVSSGRLPSAGRGLVRRADVLAAVATGGDAQAAVDERVERMLGRMA